MDIFTHYGYIGLFAASFLAATILPLSSEAVLFFMIQQSNEWALPVLVASVGNVLGSIVNYWLGYKGSYALLQKILRMNEDAVQRAVSRYQKYGKYSLLLAWVPVIGDPLTVAAGLFKTPFTVFIILVTIGKTSRYMALAFFSLI
ncbi:MAG TPA: DedA family protein [Caldithrix abyssi]|uniref:DedA family protein n=1 Tax=Caldithrix abyssi TaxID=187145 RepID=A0A7V4U1J6_CALAY|nr:DedA family protein [Caldithrix abyssi]